MVQACLDPEVVELLKALGGRLSGLEVALRASLQQMILVNLLALEPSAITEHCDDLLGMHIRLQLLLPERHWRGTEGVLTGAAEVQTLHHVCGIFLSDVTKHMIHARTNRSQPRDSGGRPEGGVEKTRYRGRGSR